MNGDSSEIPTGPTGMPPSLGTPTPPPGPPGADPQKHARLMKILQALSQMVGGVGKGIANRPGAQIQTPAQTGQPVPSTPPPQMQTQPGASPQGSAQFPMPTATPLRQPSQGSAGGSEMMSKLQPKGAAVFNAVQDISKLLQEWNNRQDQKQHVEAENIGKNLTQAIDAAQNEALPLQKRMQAAATVSEILNDKHSTKVLNKVFKGWLQKSKEAQKPGEKPDPTISGFEKGIVGGYRIPQAGPAQQAVSNQAQTAAITTGQDLARAKAGEPTAAQKAEQEKYEAEAEKYKAEVQKSALAVQKAQAEVVKTQMDLQIKQSELQLAQKKGEAQAKLDDSKYQKSLVDLDIAKMRLALAKLGPKVGGKGQLPPPTLIKSINASKQAESYVESVLNSRGDGGFTLQDVQSLGGMLKEAGASGLTQSLPGRLGRHAPSWAGGSGKKDVESMLDSIRQYKAGLETTISERYPDWKPQGSKSVASLQEDVGEEDDSDIVVDPEDVK